LARKKKRSGAHGRREQSRKGALETRFSRSINYIKSHPVAILILFLAPLVPHAYTVVGDFLGGKWSGETTLYIHSVPLRKGEPVYVFYTTPRLPEAAKIMVPVEIVLFNDSRKAAKNAVLTLKYDKATDRQKLAAIPHTYEGSLGPRELLSDVNSNYDFTYANHRMASMHPGDQVNVVDGAFALPNHTDTPSYKAPGMGLDVRASLSTDTQSSQGWDIRYRGVVASSNAQILEWVRQDYGLYVAADLRRKDGFWGYLWGWALSKKIDIFSFSVKFGRDDSERFFIPKAAPDEYKLYKFEPYVKEFIFGDGRV